MIDPEVEAEFWWDVWPFLFKEACHLACKFPDDLSRRRAAKKFKDEHMQENFDALFDAWFSLRE